MAKGTDFSIQLDEIRAPVSPNGNLLVAAGEMMGKSHAAAAAAEASSAAQKANLSTFLGTTAFEAFKGKKEADAEMEIQGVLNDFLKGQNVETDIDANNRKLAGQFLESAASDDFMGGQTVKAFTDEARKFAEARRQGVMSREEAVARIGSVVKRASAEMPGMASEFRKIAANLTGISNVDIHGIHAALTEKSQRERAREKAMEQDMQLRKEAASALGLPSIDELTPDALSFYAATKQLALRTQNAENLKKNADITQNQADQVNEQLAGSMVGQVLSGMHGRLAQLHAAVLNSDSPIKSEEATRLGGQVAAEFQLAKADVLQRINRMTVGKNALSRKRADEMIQNTGKMFDDYSEFVKSAEGMNWWKQRVKDSKGNTDFLMNTFLREHPNVMLWKELGIARDYVTAWDALSGNKQEFERRFGKTAADTMAVIQGNGIGGYNDAFRRVATGQTTIGEEHNPAHRQMIYNEVTLGLEKLMKEGGVLKNNQKDTVSNITRSWLDTFNPTSQADLEKFSRMMNSDSAVELLSQLDPEQRVKALQPFFDKVHATLGNTQKDIKGRLTTINELDINKKMGHRVEIVLDPLTQRFDIKTTEGARPERFRTSPSGAAMMGQPFVRFGGDPDTREQLATLKQRVEWLNSAPKVVARMTPLVNQDVKPSIGTMLNQLAEGIKGDKPANILGSLFQASDVPRNLATGKVLPTEAAVARHVGATGEDTLPPTPSQARDIHTSNIRSLESELSRANLDPKVKQILERELATEKAALSALGT